MLPKSTALSAASRISAAVQSSSQQGMTYGPIARSFSSAQAHGMLAAYKTDWELVISKVQCSAVDGQKWRKRDRVPGFEGSGGENIRGRRDLGDAWTGNVAVLQYISTSLLLALAELRKGLHLADSHYL
ncbi:hypothetical protein MKZ38_005718 [Zalerion maritima]|uniref:Uncharacterized protein n=1 Tax=Zalerion maritima TaxID=339359 RepID=A0AAD5RKE5_9PEZI|nr:hypothetical protein MKZ38_005718 [Zalerion maritima]